MEALFFVTAPAVVVGASVFATRHPTKRISHLENSGPARERCLF